VRQLVRWRQRWGTQAFENRWFGKIAARTRELVAPTERREFYSARNRTVSASWCASLRAEAGVRSRT
jgi:hypothetical protein